MTEEQTFREAEKDYLYAELDVVVAEKLLEEANSTAFEKAIDLVVAAMRADSENYINGILKLCRTGK